MTSNTPQLPSSPDIPLHDIKPLMEVPDQSLIWFVLTLVGTIVAVALVAYFLVQWFRKRRANTLRRKHYEALNDIDFTDAKAAAYAITRYGYTFSDDAPRLKEAYDALVERLAPYKYKKVVDPIDEETQGYLDIYVGMIDV
jgi:hypothetical protein